MRPAILAAAVSAALLAPAAAEPLTVAGCLNVLQGLRALDGYDVPAADPKAAPSRKTYKLGALRFPIALNIAALSKVEDAVSKTRQALVTEAGGDVKVREPDNQAHVISELQKLLDKPCDVTPARMKLADLRLGDGPEENAIPLSALSQMAPIIDP